MNRIFFPRRSAFTRSELVVVILVVAILTSILLPACNQVRGPAAGRTQSTNNLKQMALGIANHAAVHHGKIPPGYGPFPDPAGPERGFFFHLLPAIEQDKVYKSLLFNAPIPTYATPMDPTNPGNTSANSYCVNGRAIGGYCPKGPVAVYPGTFNVKGTSNTVIIFERYARLNGSWQGTPADNADGSCILYGPHTDVGGAVKDPSFGLPDTDPRCTLTANGYSPSSFQVALADGSVRTIVPHITASPKPPIGTTIWGWAISVTGPAAGQFGLAEVPADW